jgi:hypothetical protein
MNGANDGLVANPSFKEELRQIVQGMLDANEPEANIAAVIKQYNEDEAKALPTNVDIERLSGDDINVEDPVQPLENISDLERISNWGASAASWITDGVSNLVSETADFIERIPSKKQDSQELKEFKSKYTVDAKDLKNLNQGLFGSSETSTVEHLAGFLPKKINGKTVSIEESEIGYDAVEIRIGGGRSQTIFLNTKKAGNKGDGRLKYDSIYEAQADKINKALQGMVQRDVDRNKLPVAERKKKEISDLIDSKGHSFSAEENIVADLQEILGESYTVSEDALEKAKGDAIEESTGNSWNFNNVTVTNSDGVSWSGQLNHFGVGQTGKKGDGNASIHKDFKDGLDDFLTSAPTAEKAYGIEWVEQRDQFENNYLAAAFSKIDPKDIRLGKLTEEDIANEIKNQLEEGVDLYPDALGVPDQLVIGLGKPQGVGKTKYGQLSDNNISQAISSKYHSIKKAETMRGLNALAEEGKRAVSSGNYSYVNADGVSTTVSSEAEFFEAYRSSLISTFEDQDEKDLATANMMLLHGNLSEDGQAMYQASKEAAIAKIKDKGDNYETFIDYRTGMLINRADSGDAWAHGESVEPEIEKATARLNGELTQEGVSHFDLTQARFEKNALMIAETYDQLREKHVYSYDEYDYKLTNPGDAGGYNTITKTLTNQEALDLSYGEYGGEDGNQRWWHSNGSSPGWTLDIMNMAPVGEGGKTRDDRELLRLQIRELQIEQEALKRMYLLNEDITSVEKDGWQDANIAFREGLFFMPDPLNPKYGGGVGTDISKSHISTREMLSGYTDILTTSGLPITAEASHYNEVGWGQQLGETGAGTVGILGEFAIANKVTAGLRAVKLFSKGTRSLNAVLNARKESRFAGLLTGQRSVKTGQFIKSKNTVMTMSQIEAAAAKAGIPAKEWQLLYMSNATKIAASPWNRFSVGVVEAGIEGLKFGALPSSAGDRSGAIATGIGFGATSQVLGPIMGGFTEASFKGTSKTSVFLRNHSNQINSAYQLLAKGPTNFVVGSEIGEITLALADDWLADGGSFGEFWDDHYSDMGDNLKRFASNWIMGTGLGLTHGIPSMKSMDGLREAVSAAEGKWKTIATEHVVENIETGEVFSPPDLINYKTPEFQIIERKGQEIYRKTIVDPKTKKERPITWEEIVNFQELHLGLAEQLKRAERSHDKVDEFLQTEHMKRDAAESMKKMGEMSGVEQVVEVVSDMDMVEGKAEIGIDGKIKTYVDANGITRPVMKPGRLPSSAEVYYVDKKGNKHNHSPGMESLAKVVYRYNAERFEQGLTPHEVGHAGMSMLFGTNARFKAEFVQRMLEVAGEVDMGMGETLRDKLSELHKQYKKEYDLSYADKIHEWELFSHLSQELAKVKNFDRLKKGGAFSKYKDLVTQEMRDNLGQTYNLKTHQGLVDFFGNYVENIDKGRNPLEDLKHLEDVIISETTEVEMAKVKEAYEKAGVPMDVEGRARLQSESKAKLIAENMRLFTEKPEGWEAKKDANVQAIAKLNNALVVERGPTDGKEADDVRRDRVNLNYAKAESVIHDNTINPESRQGRFKGEAQEAILNSYKNAVIAVVNSKVGPKGKVKTPIVETPTFENVGDKNEFAWEITKPILRMHLETFNRDFREGNKDAVRNDNLDAFLNSYVKRKVGTAIQQKGIQKSEFTGSISELTARQEPIYMDDVDIVLSNKTDARFKIDAREKILDFNIDKIQSLQSDLITFKRALEEAQNNSDLKGAKEIGKQIKAKEAEIKSEEQRSADVKTGVEKLNKHLIDYIASTPAEKLPSSYEGLKDISIPKEIADLIFGKTTKQRVETIGQTWEWAQKASMPEGTIATRSGEVSIEGKSIGVNNALQTVNISKKGNPKNNKPVLFETPKKSAEFTSSKTGRMTAEADASGAGNKQKKLISFETPKKGLERIGINLEELGGGRVSYELMTPKTIEGTVIGEYIKEPGSKSAEEMIRNLKITTQTAYMNEMIRSMKYQAGMEAPNLDMLSKKLGIATEVLGNQIGAGKPRLASEKIGGQDILDQISLLRGMGTRNFKNLLESKLRNIPRGLDEKQSIKARERAVEATFKEFFNEYKLNQLAKGERVMDVSAKDLATIGRQLQKQFKFSEIGLLQKALVKRAEKSIMFPQGSAIEYTLGLPKTTISTASTKETLVEVTEAVVENFFPDIIRKNGIEAIEAMFGGFWSPSGILMHSSKADLMSGANKGTNRLGLFENVEAFNNAIELAVKGIEKGKKGKDGNWIYKPMPRANLPGYTGPSKALSNLVGNSKALQEALTMEKRPGERKRVQRKTWNLKKLKEVFEAAEYNKKVLNESIEVVRDLYQNGNLSQDAARLITENWFSQMQSLGKKSSSPAGLPDMPLAEMIKEFGEMSPENYVLEHMTPAKYTKERVYEYILTPNRVGGKINPKLKLAKQAMESTIRDSHTTIIPKSKDTMVNKTLQEDMGIDYVPGSNPIRSRYWSMFHQHRFDFGLKMHHGRFKGDVYSRSQSQTSLQQTANRKLLNESRRDMLPKRLQSESLSGAENLKLIKNLDQALANGRKRNAKRKGMSAWDFDDTLAHTKSDVIVNDPSVKQAKMYNGSPKSFSELGERSGVVFLASEAREAKAYADSQGGKVREIYVDNNKVGTEKQLLEKIEELGYSTEDALAYELIDTRFPNSLKQSEINRVIEALKKDGLLGINYTDGAQVVGGTTKSTMVFDKAIISEKPMGSRKISAEEFADQGAKLLEQGFEFDFSEFNKVTGGEPGPFLEKALERAKKFGTKDQFVLTARAPESAPAIYEFLKSQGLNIPLKNITGLGNSTGAAKAQWMLEKFAEGYNDMYFADDMMQNVEAVRDVLSQLDIKSDVQQARRLQSESMNEGLNEMIERSTGIDAVKEFSGAKARMLGKKRYTKSLVVPGAQDFMGLMQNFLGRGEQGNKDIKFFEDNLVAPFARSTKAMNEARQTSSEDLKRLYKDIPSVKKKLNKNIKNSAFTYDQAIRSYLWEKAGYEVPGLSAKDLKQMTDVVKNDAELLAFAEGLQTVSRGDYVKPSEHWVAETIVSDLFNLNNRSNRSKFIEEWTENKNIIFSEANMNKIEATQGAKFREALEDMLYRMETGSNRPSGSNRLANAHMNFINGSVGATMFLNMRSAALQTISATNYLNWAENNPAKAAAAFGNQKQYWKDFSMLWNSPMLKQRRAGLEYNVQEAELAAAVAGQKNKAKAAMSWLIKKGFTPTQLADSFAIAAGGSTYYRNRVKMYKKQGLTEAEAMDRSFLDFQEKTETSQQSSRADLISQQQASALGRTVLAWANTPMQYMRMQEKATRNIINGRGDFKTNASQIAYYGVVQSLIFAALQSALFAYGLDDEEDMDPEDLPGRLDRVVNTVIDGQLRGMGVAGAGVSAIKNTIIEFNKQELKAEDDVWYTEPDHTRTLLQLTSYSPVLGSKLRKLYSAGNTWNWNREVISEMGLDLNNPGLEAGANVIEAVTNVPLARLVRKIDNLKEVADSENQNWQRIAHLMGYSSWDVGTEDQELDAVKAEVKDRVKVKKVSEETIALEKGFIADQKKERSQGQMTTCAAVSGSGERCKKGASGKTYCTIHQKVQQNDTGKKTQCTHIKPDGKRCKVKTASKSGKCYYHD